MVDQGTSGSSARLPIHLSLLACDRSRATTSHTHNAHSSHTTLYIHPEERAACHPIPSSHSLHISIHPLNHTPTSARVSRNLAYARLDPVATLVLTTEPSPSHTRRTPLTHPCIDTHLTPARRRLHTCTPRRCRPCRSFCAQLATTFNQSSPTFFPTLPLTSSPREGVEPSS